MNDREKIKKILESEEIPVQLRPENIDLIIKSKRQQNVKYSGKSFRNQYIKIVVGLAVCAMFSTVGIYAIEKKAPAYEKTSESFSKSADTAGFTGINKNSQNSLSSIKGAENYDEVYEIFSEVSKNYNNFYNAEQESTSETYNQLDTKKLNRAVTDGKSIFSVDGDSSYVNIASVKNGEFLYRYSMDIIADFSEILQSEVCGMYITDNKLIVISENIINDRNTVTTILAYNIAYQNEKPVLAYLGEYSQNGNFSDIQINDDYIYIITSETKDLSSEINSEDYEKYLPEYYINGEKYYPEPENIYIPSDLHELNSEELNTGFTTAGALKINQDYGNINTDRNGDIFIETDIKAFAKSAEFVYCSENNLYVTVSNYTNAYTENTDILKFSLSDGNIIQQSVANVKGIPISQMSMNEYNDYFAIAVMYIPDTQIVNTKYALYVLDSDMNTVGLLDDFNNIQQDINDFRFFEDTAYAFTYSEQSEPTFAIDLSNPENPLLNDDLKLIYGGYMQRWNDSLILSFNSLQNQNIFKISMIENKDINITAELTDKSDDLAMSGSPALEDSQSMLTVPEKNIIGIPYYLQKYSDEFVTLVYELYSFENNSFNYIGNVSDYENEFCYGMNRALYIDDYIYIICGKQFISFSIENCETLDICQFQR